MKLCIRPLFYYLLAFASFLLACALFLQYVLGMMPCTLCIIDRLIVSILIGLFLIAIWHNPSSSLGQRSYSSVCFAFSLAGVAMTGRQLWLMHSVKGNNIPDCSPGWEYLITNLPLNEALTTMFMGSKECIHDVGSFLGLSLPTWTLVGFIILAIGSLLPWRCKR
jgi:disulfide bond formation protein DsbB